MSSNNVQNHNHHRHHHHCHRAISQRPWGPRRSIGDRAKPQRPDESLPLSLSVPISFLAQLSSTSMSVFLLQSPLSEPLVQLYTVAFVETSPRKTVLNMNIHSLAGCYYTIHYPPVDVGHPALSSAPCFSPCTVNRSKTRPLGDGTFALVSSRLSG